MIRQVKTQRRTTADVVVGIDPDADKNGVAIYDAETRSLTAAAMTFPDTLECLRYVTARAKAAGKRICIVIEAGWLNKAHWHVGYNDSRQQAAAKGNDVGRNHETGRKIAEMCEHWQIPYELIKPLALKAGGREPMEGKGRKDNRRGTEKVIGLKENNLYLYTL